MTKDEIYVDPRARDSPSLSRDLDTLKANLKIFTDIYHSDTKQQSKAMNVVDEVFFDIPIDQVIKQRLLVYDLFI